MRKIPSRLPTIKILVILFVFAPVVLIVSIGNLSILLSLLFVIANLLAGPRYADINVTWQQNNTSPTMISFVDGYYEGRTFAWKGDMYTASSKPRKYAGEDIDYFVLSKNGKRVWSLKNDHNAMEFAQFFDCGKQLCIWGIGAVEETTAGLEDGIGLLLWPSKKKLKITRPCTGLGRYDALEGLDVQIREQAQFVVTAHCIGYKNTQNGKLEKGETWQTTNVELTKFL